MVRAALHGTMPEDEDPEPRRPRGLVSRERGDDVCRLVAYLPPPLLARARLVAVAQDVTLSELTTKALEAHLSGNGTAELRQILEGLSPRPKRSRRAPKRRAR